MSKQKLGRDNWLHILSNAIANYANEGGRVYIVTNFAGDVVIRLVGVEKHDQRLHPDFKDLVGQGGEQ